MSTEIAEKAGEIAAENVEDVVDGVVEVVEVFRNNPVALAAAGVVGLAAGIGGGYLLARKLLERKYAEELDEQMEIAKAFYADLNKVSVDGEPLTPQEVMDRQHGEGAAAAALREYQGRDVPQNETLSLPDEEDEAQLARTEKKVLIKEIEDDHGTEVVEVKSEVNIFSDDTFDLEAEKMFRTADRPYIITRDEFYSGEPDNQTSELTYFEGDGVVMDEGDKALDDVDGLIGEEHLVRFGSGSGVHNLIYIRNEKIGMDFAITKSKGTYARDVLDLPEENPNELKHSSRRSFRRGDE